MAAFQILLKVLVLLTYVGALVSGESALVCHADSYQITCPESTRIVITSAAYGNSGANKCTTHDAPSPCISTDSFVQVNKRCFAKQECELEANLAMFSNPCPGMGKYLEVDYECVDANLFYPICAEKTIGQTHTILTDQEVYVYTDNYPADYDRNLNCMTTFLAEQEKAIGVAVIDFALPFPCKDNLEMNDEELCNLFLNNVVKIGNTSQIIDVSQLSIHFESPGTGAKKRGFIIRLHVTGCPSATLPVLVNGGFTVTVAGAEATYYCTEGYHLIGGATKQCVDEPIWGGEIGECEEKVMGTGDNSAEEGPTEESPTDEGETHGGRTDEENTSDEETTGGLNDVHTGGSNPEQVANLEDLPAEGAPRPPAKVAFFVRCKMSRPWMDRTPFPFEDIITNVGNGFDDTSSQFVAPVKGTYLFSWTTLSYLREGLVGLMVNDDPKPVTASWSPPVNPHAGQPRPTGSNQIIKQLEAGDRVFLKLLSGDVYCGAVFGYADSVVTFTGYLLWEDSDAEGNW